MGNGDTEDLADPEAAELAARQAIKADAGDWRAHVALAAALRARKRVYDGRTATAMAEGSAAANRVKEAVVAARRAVALAPEEAEAHLALADALLAVAPRRFRSRAAVTTALARAELLGMDRHELADRRSRNRPGDISFFITMMPTWLLIPFLSDHHNGTVSRTVAGTMLAGYICVILILRIWPAGEPLNKALGARRKLARKRLETDGPASQGMPFIGLPFTLLIIAAAFLSIPGVDGNAPSRPAAWLLLGSVPLITAATWIGVDRWYGPGMMLVILRHNRFVALSVAIAVILATTSPVSALLKVERPGIWFTLFLSQMAWGIVTLVAVIRADSRTAERPEATRRSGRWTRP